LANENSKREKAEQELSERSVLLQEKSIALQKLMDQKDADKRRFERQIKTNVTQLVLPLVQRMRSNGTSVDKMYLDLLEENLATLTSSLGINTTNPMFRLTGREIELCNMIAGGLETTAIARLLKLSKRTVDAHRNHIRKKLRMANRETNLKAYLKLLQADAAF
jgi:DNA-binding CsgD family transcriptional regulator